MALFLSLFLDSGPRRRLAENLVASYLLLAVLLGVALSVFVDSRWAVPGVAVVGWARHFRPYNKVGNMGITNREIITKHKLLLSIVL